MLGALRLVCTPSPDGKHLASGSGKAIRVWDSESGELVIDIFESHSDFINSVCYSPDGNRIVSGSDDETIRIWDASNATLLLILQGHTDWIHFVTYSYDGLHILSGSGDGTLRVWDANNGEQIQEPIKEYGDDMRSICFSPDNAYFVSGSWDKTICVWNTLTRKILFKSNGTSVVNSIVFLPSSDSKCIKFVSASTDRLVRIRNVDVGLEERIWNTPGSDGWIIGK